MVHTHRDQVLLSRPDIGCGVIEEGDITVWSFAQQVTVHIDLTAVVDPFEVEIHLFRCGRCRHLNSFAVPPYSSRQIARAACQGGTQLLPDTPVVGQLYSLPPTVIDRYFLTLFHVAKHKFPVAVDLLCRTKTGLAKRKNSKK